MERERERNAEDRERETLGREGALAVVRETRDVSGSTWFLQFGGKCWFGISGEYSLPKNQGIPVLLPTKHENEGEEWVGPVPFQRSRLSNISQEITSLEGLLLVGALPKVPTLSLNTKNNSNNNILTSIAGFTVSLSRMVDSSKDLTLAWRSARCGSASRSTSGHPCCLPSTAAPPPSLGSPLFPPS